MRIQLKGGVWKNSEDEVLKAAVMKYGLNNWYEWLNPYVKKTEWSREEEEKLLHLAKLFPTQWRTIAPMIGRTAHQCLEHYERLLDQAQGRDEDDELDPRRLRPGEIDPSPESRPCRADAVDMDDDEKEMLAEARARLANTRGKKAKRKAREKQIEQTRRLASLQKRRELKNAGVIVGKLKLHNSIMNYATEVPLETQPPKGFYEPETDHEIDQSIRSIRQLEGSQRDEEMKRMRLDDARKIKKLQNDNISESMAIFEKYEEKTITRGKLVMPEPTITDDEIVQIVKMGTDVQMLDDNVAASSVARTPMTNSIMEEARLAAVSSRLQTPLLGETPVDSTPINNGPGSFIGPSTPNPLKRLVANTPQSMLLGRFGSVMSSKYSDTPASAYDSGSTYDDDDDPIGAEARMDMAKLHVRASISNLPMPQSQVEISIADIPDIQVEMQESLEPDRGEVERQKIAYNAEQKSTNLTSAIKQNVDRPLVYNNIVFVNDMERHNEDPELKAASELIHQEFVKLVQWDSIHHPQPGGKPCTTNSPEKDVIESEYLGASEHELNVETARLKSILGVTDEFLNVDEWWVPIVIRFTTFSKIIDTFGYCTLKKRFLPEEKLQLSQKTPALKLQCAELEKQLAALGNRNKTLENKCNLATAGYKHREELQLRAIGDVYDKIVSLSDDLQVHRSMRERENALAESRIAFQLKLLQQEKELNAELQRLYGSLTMV
ncbi:cell division cycle 5-like protein [Babesia divergens]|uniref:Cell division cycle 5-like protein n=1 Tax=Babesia divergens TaxID=32595 RepID=A0AAD9LI26_BABDI|nr:cell division cycle 5-like protein [Babesia divergens]